MPDLDLQKARALLQRTEATVSGEGLRHRLLPQVLAVARMSPEGLKRLELNRLRKALAHAQETVPFWKDLFAERSFRPEALRSREDLQALPILTKEVVRAQGRRMLSAAFPAERLMERRTGGSTGEPLVFWQDRATHEHQMATHLRTLRLLGLEAGEGEARIWGYGRPMTLPNLLGRLTGRLFLDAFHTDENRLRSWCHRISHLGPSLIYGYPSAIHSLGRYARDHGVSFPTVRWVATTAEQLEPSVRSDIANTFSAGVSDLYGSHESVRIAWECPSGRMHVAADVAHLEFCPDPTLPRGSHRILLSTLQPGAMPLFRYDLGDFGEPIEEPCPCGLPFPVMAMKMGKIHHVLTLGRSPVHTSTLTKHLYPLDALSRFQARCRPPYCVTVSAVPRPGLTREARRQLHQATAALRQELGGEVQIQIRLVDRIPLTRRGKHQPVIVESTA